MELGLSNLDFRMELGCRQSEEPDLVFSLATESPRQNSFLCKAEQSMSVLVIENLLWRPASYNGAEKNSENVLICEQDWQDHAKDLIRFRVKNTKLHTRQLHIICLNITHKSQYFYDSIDQRENRRVYGMQIVHGFLSIAIATTMTIVMMT